MQAIPFLILFILQNSQQRAPSSHVSSLKYGQIQTKILKGACQGSISLFNVHREISTCNCVSRLLHPYFACRISTIQNSNDERSNFDLFAVC